MKVTSGRTVVLDLSLTKAAKAQLARHSLKITLQVTFKNAAGKTTPATKTVTVARSPACGHGSNC